MMLDDTPSFMLPVSGFQAAKAAQISAFFATMAGDRGIPKLKLIKLVYLSERRFLKEHGMPMLFDELYSLPNGPICSSALNGIDQKVQPEIWGPLLCKNGNIVFPCARIERSQMDEVSDAEMAILEFVWEQFKGYSASQIRNWTHDNCAEYVEVPEGTRMPIKYVELLEAVGYTRDDAEEVEREIQAIRKTESVLAS